MVRINIILYWFFFPCWLVHHDGEIVQFKNSIEIFHDVKVQHPGKGKDNIEEAILVEIQNKKGISVAYYMDVESVICIQKVCKIVPVRIYWNAIGEYQQYEMEEGITLEKYEADIFEEQDYIKLNSILANINSPFKEVNVDEILKVPDETHNDIDAVSGATAIELDEKDTVPGAALTCYTLWHWANGEIISVIQDFTAQSFKASNFESYLVSAKGQQQLFALEKLAAKKLFNKALVKNAIDEVSKNEILLKPTINYMEQADEKIYFSALEQLFLEGNNKQKIAVLTSLLNTTKIVSKKQLDRLSRYTLNLDSFQAVSVYLRLMNQKNANSSVVIKNTWPLLEDDMLIARNAYWFLKKQDITVAQQEILKDFQQKHKDQLE